MALVTLVVVMIAVAVVAIVTIVAVAAVVQMRGLALGLHCADCIICIVRIVSCRLHCADDIVRIASCGLHCADCIVPSAVLYRLECADKRCDVCKRGGIDRPKLHGSKQLYALPCNEGIRCTKNRRFCTLLEELPCRTPRGIRLDSEVAMPIVEKPIHVLPTVTAN